MVGAHSRNAIDISAREVRMTTLQQFVSGMICGLPIALACLIAILWNGAPI
jgi:formate/nitrite transporter FocA (FNT family)